MKNRSPVGIFPRDTGWPKHWDSSKEDRTIGELLTLLNDPQPNVVCQALYALGKRGGDRRPDIVETILAKIGSTDNWYVQRYAYLALRSLGWRQPASN